MRDPEKTVFQLLQRNEYLIGPEVGILSPGGFLDAAAQIDLLEKSELPEFNFLQYSLLLKDLKLQRLDGQRLQTIKVIRE